MKIGLRDATSEDYAYARDVYFETMRWIIESLFGWDQGHEEKKFAAFFNHEEARIITCDGSNIGWIQEQINDTTINLGSFYITPAMQGRGIGTHVLQKLKSYATSQSKALTLAVVKMNPALGFYEKRGFRITHEDDYKFYMRADPPRR